MLLQADSLLALCKVELILAITHFKGLFKGLLQNQKDSHCIILLKKQFIIDL